jgi:sugar phosphate isomerase/epimerase
MKKLNRRSFLRATAAGMATTVIFPFGLSGCKRSKLEFGFQSWTLREQLAEDFSGTLKRMAEMGYSSIEMCSPLGYKDSGFGSFQAMKGSEIRKIIEDAGLVCQSAHYTFDELKNNLENRIEWSHEMGIKQIILSSFWIPEGSLDEYLQACDQLNRIAGNIQKAGLITGFHNHHMEFEKRNDTLIYDALMNRLDPDLVKMQFQVAVINIGYKAADYFRQYPGRFISAHLADWSQEKETQVPIGQGMVDWNEFFEAAKVGGVENYFVEMEPAAFEESARFLKTL